MTEQVLVFRQSVLDSHLPNWSGALVGPQALRAASKILNSDNLFFKDRAEAETDESLKQVIPYIVIRRGSQVLAYARTKKSGETRLHSKRSLGFGGHINPIDGSGNLSYEKCFWRELEEELGIERKSVGSFPLPTGIVYETETPVGRVHFGIVHVLDVPADFAFDSKDESLADIQWLDVSSLKEEAATSAVKFENWSQLVIDNIVL